MVQYAGYQKESHLTKLECGQGEEEVRVDREKGWLKKVFWKRGHLIWVLNASKPVGKEKEDGTEKGGSRRDLSDSGRAQGQWQVVREEGRVGTKSWRASYDAKDLSITI